MGIFDSITGSTEPDKGDPAYYQNMVDDEPIHKVIAFNDAVGYACGANCAYRAVNDINGDHEDANATHEPVACWPSGHCMGCGAPL